MLLFSGGAPGPLIFQPSPRRGKIAELEFGLALFVFSTGPRVFFLAGPFSETKGVQILLRLSIFFSFPMRDGS